MTWTAGSVPQQRDRLPSQQNGLSHLEERIDAIFVGPSDLAASMGLPGRQDHPEVRAAVERCLTADKAAGKPAGVNTFVPATARSYLDVGAEVILVGADVALLCRGRKALAAKYAQTTADSHTSASY